MNRRRTATEILTITHRATGCDARRLSATGPTLETFCWCLTKKFIHVHNNNSVVFNQIMVKPHITYKNTWSIPITTTPLPSKHQFFHTPLMFSSLIFCNMAEQHNFMPGMTDPHFSPSAFFVYSSA